MRPMAAFLLLLCLPDLLEAEITESRRGDFRVETTMEQRDANEGQGATAWVARVRSGSGTVLYDIRRAVPYGSPFPRVQASDHAGEAVLVEAFSGIVEFYDPRGVLVRRWLPFGEAGPDHERILKCSMAGGRVVFLLSAPTPPGVQVVFCTVAGRELWSRTLTHASAAELYLSDDGETIIASSYSSGGTLLTETALLDGRGREIRVLPLLMRHADVNPSGERFAVADRSEMVYGRVDGASADRRWRPAQPEGVITGVVCDGETTAVVVEEIQTGPGGIRYANPSAVFLDDAGREVRAETRSGTNAVSTGLTVHDGQLRLRRPGETGRSLDN